MTGFFDSKQMDSKEAGWVGVHSQMYFIFFCYAVRFGSCMKNTTPAHPQKKIKYTFTIYTHLRQSNPNSLRKSFGGIIFNIQQDDTSSQSDGTHRAVMVKPEISVMHLILTAIA